MKKIFKNSIFIFLIILISNFTLYIVSVHHKKGQISSINSMAMHHYNSFTNGLIELENFPDIKVNGENYILGECRDCSNYTAYKGDSVKDNTLIYGKNEYIANGYWAIKIVNGKVEAVWASNYPLQEKQLVEYSEKEQLKEITIIKKFDKYQLIGYYKAE